MLCPRRQLAVRENKEPHMKTDVVSELEKRSIDLDFFLGAAANMQKLALATTLAKNTSDRQVEETGEIIAAIEDEEKAVSAKMKARTSGMVKDSLFSSSEKVAFDRIPTAIKYAEFLITQKHSFKSEAKVSRNQ